MNKNDDFKKDLAAAEKREQIAAKQEGTMKNFFAGLSSKVRRRMRQLSREDVEAKLGRKLTWAEQMTRSMKP